MIGAGITGLSLTKALAERDIDVVTFEAASEPGGVIRSNRVNNRILEFGPQRLRLTPAVSNLIEDVDLINSLRTGQDDLPLYLYVDGELHRVPKSIGQFLRTDLLSWSAKARLLSEPLRNPIDPNETAAETFIRKFGPETYHRLIEPLFGGMYGSDPARMPSGYALEPLSRLESAHGSLVRAALARLRSGETPPVASFDGGLQELPDALYEQHDPYVHLDAPVSAIRTEPGVTGYRLDIGDRSMGVDQVVMTTPASVTARLLEPLQNIQVEPLAQLTYNSLAVVHLISDLSMDGFGYQVSRSAPLSTLGVTWNASLFGRDGVYTAFLGGMWEPELLERPREEIGAVARKEFERVTGASATVERVTVLEDIIPAYDESWRGLSALSIPPGITLAGNYMGRAGISARVRTANSTAESVAAGDPPANG